MELSFNPFGLTHFIQHLNVISFFILLLLLFMSVLSWYLIIRKMLQLGFTYFRAKKLLKIFSKASSWEPIMAYLIKRQLTDPISNLALQAINAALYYEKRAEKQLPNLCSHNEFLTRNLRRAISEATTQLEAGLTILASIGSTAPFIGLLGTVLGIYDALITISTKGNASLDTVAAPVGEALIMTAVGLAVAIPAVLGYNTLIRGNRSFLNKLEGFAHDLHTCLNTGACMDMKNRTLIRLRNESSIKPEVN